MVGIVANVGDLSAYTDIDALPEQVGFLLRHHLAPENITKGLDMLRDMKSLKTIVTGTNRALPAAEFWERYDKGEFTK